MRSWEPESVTGAVIAACLILQRRPVAALSYFAVAGSRDESIMVKNIEDNIEESGLLGINPTTKGYRSKMQLSCWAVPIAKYIALQDGAVVQQTKIYIFLAGFDVRYGLNGARVTKFRCPQQAAERKVNSHHMQ